MINIVTEALRRIFLTLTTNMGLIDEAKPIINMKQELTQWLLYVATRIDHSFNCWEGN